jgi:hypothetical protein
MNCLSDGNRALFRPAESAQFSPGVDTNTGVRESQMAGAFSGLSAYMPSDPDVLWVGLSGCYSNLADELRGLT